MNRHGLTTSIVMEVPADRIFHLAANVRDWATMLPHYRYVRVQSDENGRLRATMSARRGPVPVWWQSDVTTNSEIPIIEFDHTAGFTKGMRVQWTFQPAGSGTLVVIRHDEKTITPTWRRLIVRYAVGRLIIDPIATQTLRSFKQIAEQA